MFPVSIPNCYINDNGTSGAGITATIDLDKYQFRLKGLRPDLIKIKSRVIMSLDAKTQDHVYFVRVILPKDFEGVTSMEQLKVVCDMKGLTKGSEHRLPTRQLHMELDNVKTIQNS